MLPSIYRVTEEQVKTGTGAPETIPLAPEVNYAKNTRTNNELEANGIRFTPGGEFIIFDSLNNGELYRMTPPPPGNPAAREIVTIGGVTPEQVGNADGLEFLDSNTLYSVDNAVTKEENTLFGDESPERIVKLHLSDDYLTARVLDVKKSNKFRTPTSVSKAPRDRLLVNNAEFFDGDGMEPFFVLSIPRP